MYDFRSGSLSFRIQEQVIPLFKRRDDDIQPVVVVHVYQSDVDGLLASRRLIRPADFFKTFAVDILVQLETVVRRHGDVGPTVVVEVAGGDPPTKKEGIEKNSWRQFI